MLLRCTLVHFIYFLCQFSTLSNSYILLHHTESSPSLQYFDCIYYTKASIPNAIQGVKYCRQLFDSLPSHLDHNPACQNGGQLLRFEELSDLNLSISDILRWSSSMEQVDRYSKYLSNSTFYIEDAFICNCTNPSTFGKFCEYTFYGGSTTFDEEIKKQFRPLERADISIGSQLHRNRPCYMTLACYTGLMCLDWRHVCDGKNDRFKDLINNYFFLF
jgi:hypothetical protein